VLKDNHPDSAVQQLPESVQEAVSPSGTIGLRVPAHPVLQAVLRLSAGPLVLSSANRTGQGDAVTAKEVVQSLGGDVELVLDDGRCKFAQPSSVVRVNESGFEVLRAGVFSEAALKRLSGLVIVLVCTGNTCRSPMAEAMLKKKVADKLGCKVEELEDRGIMIASAGIAAMAGGRSAAEAIQAMKERKLDVSQHESQPLSERLARHADFVITMTHGHRDAVIAQWPDAAPRTFTLCDDGRDVADPIGGPIEWYRRCAEEMDKELDRWVEEIDFTTPALVNTP
jgi:protein-tyrosine phosphatase